MIRLWVCKYNKDNRIVIQDKGKDEKYYATSYYNLLSFKKNKRRKLTINNLNIIIRYYSFPTKYKVKYYKEFSKLYFHDIIKILKKKNLL